MADTQPSPEIVFETFTAFQRTATLKAAVDLDVFTAIGEGTVTPAALATNPRDERQTRIVQSICHCPVYLRFVVIDPVARESEIVTTSPA